ncbi:serine/threonine-protein kinase haspin isoform X2 [Fukomys damarensis]|uniref:serine/threonine-protein kinase haspin isoform X1 n=1 Tax=Fukomys damarensis TaxID=885580 RepID=UPI00053FF833|nr:serine/threonine-protein kinase haspin isoform X1 [Fukomys damarensis]XP_010609675.1 serine/threonine-protein kinase haspin isoform X2 [Fukomys damarensis]
MAASFRRPESRLFRTYGAAGGARPRQQRPGRTAARWFPPQEQEHLFSSSDANSSSPSQSFASDDPDDPDFPCSPVGRRRRRPGGRISKGRPTLAETPRRMRLRPRPPQKCSTPCDPLRPPPFPSSHLDRLSPDLSVSSPPRDGEELGTSASLFSAPASTDLGPPVPRDSIISIGSSASPDAASTVTSGFHVPAASQGQASVPSSQEASKGGGFNRMVHRARASLRSAPFSLMDSENPEDSEFGTDEKNMRESHCKRQLTRNRLESLGLRSTGKKRTTDQSSFQKLGSQGAIGKDCEEASGCKGLVVSRKINRPKRTGLSQKRKHQQVETSVIHYHNLKKDQKMGKDSFLSQDLTSQACSWVKTKASFSLHKKKVVTDISEGCSSYTVASSLSGSLISENSSLSTMNRTNSALDPWHSSSMYLLSPLRSPRVGDKKASDAKKVYGECNQEGPIPFSYCLSSEKLERCEKIGEGVFGEVFQTITDNIPVALKIIAIEGAGLVNGSHQKTFEEILPEIIISKELSLLSGEVYNHTEGFIGLNSVHCVQGSYPPLLLKAWDHYNSTKGSANDRPDFFEEDQLFIILEFEFGGIDLEQMKTKLSSIATAKSILHQITASLAVAEASLHFEHRDLHWGNVLLKKTHLRELHYTLNGKTSTIPTHGLQVNIIDYTLSRLERDGIVVFCDISMDEDLFTGEGDYQFEIYRLMRKENNNCWCEYHPYNNVLWLHYLTDKILNHMTFKRKYNTPALKQMKKKIQHFYRTVLNFSSATDLLCQHSLFQ